MKKKKREITEGIELPNQESIWRLGEKENYKFFGLLEVDIPKQTERKEKKIRKVYLRITRKLPKT